MPVDIRDQLDRAAGAPGGRPDVAAAIRRGTRLRRRRQVTLAVACTAAVGLLISGPAGMWGPSGQQTQIAPIGDQQPATSWSQLDVFQRPATEDDRNEAFGYTFSGSFERPGLQRPTPRLDEPAPRTSGEQPADADSHPLDFDHEAARLAWQGPDELRVRVAPPVGDPVDPDLRPLEGSWVYVVLKKPGYWFLSSAPVPARGTATWAGSVPIGGTLTGILLVGNGLDVAHSDDGPVNVQGNVVVLDDFGRGDQITLTGPAGEYTLAIPPDPTTTDP